MQYSSPSVTCAENISLLYLLHSVPTLPSSNIIGHLQRRQTGYTLPFSRERGLASTLAFLANTKVDTNHIPALCIKETTASLDVLLAVNKTSWEDGNENLLQLQKDFNALFAILSNVAGRLRFTSRTPRQPLKAVLNEAIRGIQRLSDIQVECHRQTARLFIERSKAVMKLADAWSRHQKTTQLKQLIEGIYHLSQIGKLDSLFNVIQNQDMCPSSRKNLINIVSKVSRYREAARYLYRTAKRFQIVRHMETILVKLPKEAFHRTLITDCSPTVESITKRITGHRQGSEIRHLCRLLKITEHQLNDQFVNQTRKTLEKSKIHAEIQLMYYCESNIFDRPPRIICSSKDACFLCNAFILMHGKMHTPRHHGRLYPGWRLPPWISSLNLEARFAKVLEQQIRSSLETLLARRRKTEYPDPNESTLLSLSMSTTTIHSMAVSGVASQIAIFPQQCPPNSHVTDRNGSQTQLTTSSSESESSQNSSSTTQQNEIGKTVEETLRSSSTASLVSQTQPQSPSVSEPTSLSLTTDKILIQGTPIISSPAVAFYIAGILEINLEQVTTTGHSYIIEWLANEEAECLRASQKANVVDVDTLQGDTLYTLHVQNVVLLATHGVLVRITKRT